MLAYIVRRLLVAIPTLLILVILSFILMQNSPGSPFQTEKGMPAEVMANIRARYGLDESLLLQVWHYLTKIVLHFDFGPSFKYLDRDVNEIIGTGFPITLKYGLVSFVVATTLGIALGVASALRHNSAFDYTTAGVTFTAQSLPNFVLAPILVMIFTQWLGWLPGGGWNGGQWQYLVMPVIAMSVGYLASISRITRSSMLEVLHSNFIRTAKAKGLPMRSIIWRHAMKPTMMPVVSYLGPAFVGMITGSIVIDSYFSTGGIGAAFINSALSRDYSVMMGVTILYGSLTILFNLLTDVLYAWLDPKIRY
jgi:oligopeptide transport system permease protein